MSLVPETVEQLQPGSEIVATLAANICPKCQKARLGSLNLYCGGRGYVTYDICSSEDCDYQARAS